MLHAQNATDFHKQQVSHFLIIKYTNKRSKGKVQRKRKVYTGVSREEGGGGGRQISFITDTTYGGAKISTEITYIPFCISRHF